MAIQVVKIRDFLGHTQAVYALCLDRERRRIFSSGGDGMVVEWTMDAIDGILIMRHEDAVYSLFEENGILYSGTRKGIVGVCDTVSKVGRTLQVSNSSIYGIRIYNENILLLCGDGCLYIYTLDLKFLHSVKVSNKSLRSIAFTDQGFAVSASDGYVYFMKSDYSISRSLKVSSDSVFALAYDQGKKTVYTGGKDAYISMYNDFKLHASVPAHTLHVHCLSLSDDKDLLLSSSMDKTIKIWDSKTLELLKVIQYDTFDAHRSSVNKILWFDKNNFISCSDDRTLKCFEIQQTFT